MCIRDRHNKVQNFMEQNNITELKHDPTDRYQNTVKQLVNKAKQIMTHKQKPYMKQIQPSAPTLQALPKIHKEDIPIHPIINYRNAPAYKLAKHLDKIIRQHTQLDNNIAVKNNTDLVTKIKDIHIPHNATLASFDIKNLYTTSPSLKQSPSYKTNSNRTTHQTNLSMN